MCGGQRVGGGPRDWEACRGLILNSLQCLGGWEASGRGEPVPGRWGGERLEAGVGETGEEPKVLSQIWGWGAWPQVERKECSRGRGQSRVGSDLPEAHAVGLLPDLSQPQPLLHFAVPGDRAGGQLGGCKPLPFPFRPGPTGPRGATCGRLSSYAARRGVQAAVSPASRAAAPATCRTCARSHPSARSPPGEDGVGVLQLLARAWPVRPSPSFPRGPGGP